MTKPKLTMKQAKFVEGIAQGKTKTDSYVEAYEVSPETPRKSLHEMASQTSSIPQVKEALEDLFGLEETKQIVSNVHKLAISAQDEKVQLEASKEWLNRAIPKSSGNATINNFGQMVVQAKDKYDD